MSILRSMSFHQELPDPDVMYQLFKDLPDCKDFDSSIEIIEAAMEGRINLDKEFNLAGYDYAIKNNKKMDKSKKADKMVSLDDNEDDNAAADRILTHCILDDPYEELMEEDEVRYAVCKLVSLRNEFIADAGVDYIVTIRLALNGVSDAVNCLRDLCENYSPLSEHIQIVLASGIPFGELFPEEIANHTVQSKKVSEVVEPITGYTEVADNVISLERDVKTCEKPKKDFSEVGFGSENRELNSKVLRLGGGCRLRSGFYKNRRDGCFNHVNLPNRRNAVFEYFKVKALCFQYARKEGDFIRCRSGTGVATCW